MIVHLAVAGADASRCFWEAGEEHETETRRESAEAAYPAVIAGRPWSRAERSRIRRDAGTYARASRWAADWESDTSFGPAVATCTGRH